MYKILIGKYDVDVTLKVLRVYDLTTRGNMFKLNKGRAKYDLRKFYFTNRVVICRTAVRVTSSFSETPRTSVSSTRSTTLII